MRPAAWSFFAAQAALLSLLGGCQPITRNFDGSGGGTTTTTTDSGSGTTTSGTTSTTMTTGTCTNAGEVDCHGNCVDPTKDVNNCGRCDKDCRDELKFTTGVACSSGACTYAACLDGYGDCDGKPENGCEADTQNTAETCGGACTNCRQAVQNVDSVSCAAGACQYGNCSRDLGDCDGDRSNGCEAYVLGAVTTCGGQCVDCSGTVSNVSNASCSGGFCDYDVCQAPYVDCDGNRRNGCEANVDHDVTACGLSCVDCMTTVKNANGVACNAARCGYNGGCAPGGADCDGKPENGCEADATALLTCGPTCVNCQLKVQHATPMCNGTSCGYSGACQAGWGNCDSKPENGCETDVYNSVGACGPSCVDCNAQLQHAAGRSCTTGTCKFTGCDTGWNNCDGNLANGCEAGTSAPKTCGASCTDCTIQVQHATGTCNGSTCGFNGTCQTGWGSCDSKPENGCETDLNTSAANCGTCGFSCDGGTCQNGLCQPVVLATGFTEPRGIVVDATAVYVADRWAGSITKVPLAGGTKTVLTTGLAYPEMLAQDASYVYSVATGGVSSSIARVSKTTASAILPTLVTSLASGWTPTGLAVEGNNVYWVDYNSTSAQPGRVSYALAAGGTGVALATDASWPRGMAILSSWIYYTTAAGSSGYVNRVPLSGGTPTKLSAAMSSPAAIATDGTNVYVTDTNKGALYRLPVGSVNATPVEMITGSSAMRAVVTDGSKVYVTGDDGTIRVVPVSGTAGALTLASGQGSPKGLAIDYASGTTPGHVYWTTILPDGSGGALLRRVR